MPRNEKNAANEVIEIKKVDIRTVAVRIVGKLL